MSQVSRSLDLNFEFPVIDGIIYTRINGYFSPHMKTNIPCTSTTHNLYVQYVIDPESLRHLMYTGQIRIYYRTIADGYHAVFRSTNVVKVF